MSRLFLSNIPRDCKEPELQQWVESHGFQVTSIRVISCAVTGASPAFGYVCPRDARKEIDPISILNGQPLRGSILQVKQDWRKTEGHISSPAQAIHAGTPSKS